MSILKHLLSGMLVFWLTACGGGGSSSNNGNAQSVGNSPPVFGPDPDPVIYDGVSSAAVVASDNIAELIYAVFSESSEEPAVSANSGDNTVIANNPERRTASAAIIGASKTVSPSNNRDFRIAANVSGPLSASEELIDIEYCYPGTINYFGDLDEDNIGYVIADHDGCVRDNTRTDGRTRLDIDDYLSTSRVIVKGKFEYKRLTTTYGITDQTGSGDFSNTISGTVDFRLLDVEDAVEESISNTVIRDDESGKMLRFVDFIQVIEFDSLENQIPASMTMSGRIYSSDHGYIDVETLSPILLNPVGLGSPAFGGRFRITGASDAQALITLLGGHIMLAELDIDADGVYEQTVYFNSSRLFDWIYADITDSDGDGIPDRWEEQYGLDSQTSDSGDDFDGDQVSNLDEYIRGTAPNNAALLPSVADLRLILNLDNDPFLSINEKTQLIFRLKNEGPNASGLTVVSIDLPDTLQLHYIHWPNGDRCPVEGNSITCLFQDLEAGATQDIVVEVTLPSSVDDYSIDGRIRSLAVNSDSTNNEAYHIIEVRPPSAELTVVLTDSPDPVAVDNEVTYTIRVENRGDANAENWTTVHVLPAGATATLTLSNCEQVDNIVTCVFPSLSSGSERGFGYSVVVPNVIGEIASSVTVSSDTLELDSDDNEASQTTDLVEAKADLLVTTEAVEIGTLAGSERDCDFQISNMGPDYVEHFELNINVPPGVTPLLEGAVGGSCTQTDQKVTCAATFTRPFSGRIIEFPCMSSMPGIYNIQAVASSQAVDEDLSNNTASKYLFYGEPLDDIQSKIDAAADGETVTVPPGFYIGELSYLNKSIRLVSSDGPDSTYICGVTTPFYPGPEGEISGFTFTHSPDTLIFLNNSNIEIKNNVFENMVIGGRLINVNLSSSPIIESNVIRNNVTQNECYTGLITVGSDANPIIRNNLFENSNCSAIIVSGGNDAQGLPQVFNNTIVGNQAGLELLNSARGVYKNNIIYDNRYGVKLSLFDHTCDEVCDMLQSNLIFNNYSDYEELADQTFLSGNISVDPLFVDPANSDYRLSIGSPAIDAGSAENAPADDLLGNPRPFDGDRSGTAEPDIGAYEFQVTP